MKHLQRISDEGTQAYNDGRGESACPYIDCTENILAVGYWQTPAAERQVWMQGFREAALMNLAELGRRSRPNVWGS